LTISSIVATTLLLVGCGSSSSSSDSPKTTSNLIDTPTSPPAISTPTIENPMIGKGYYVDSAVEGVNYECGTRNGTTDANGTFNFERGRDCEFKLGEVKLRKVDGNLLEDNITILEDNETVAQLLQTLDADGNASNGIQIPAHSEKVVADTIASIDDLNQEILEVIHTSIKTEYPNEYNGTVVDINQTRRHLAETRQELASENRRTQYDVEHENNVTQIPTPIPTAIPTEAPTSMPTAVPTETPTSMPTAVPTETPTSMPTAVPTETPTSMPTAVPTEAPTSMPTAVPTETPTSMPTAVPTETPTSMPTAVPTETPTSTPAAVPTGIPNMNGSGNSNGHNGFGK
jgi:hypothetical protein